MGHAPFSPNTKRKPKKQPKKKMVGSFSSKPAENTSQALPGAVCKLGHRAPTAPKVGNLEPAPPVLGRSGNGEGEASGCQRRAGKSCSNSLKFLAGSLTPSHNKPQELKPVPCAPLLCHTDSKEDTKSRSSEPELAPKVMRTTRASGQHSQGFRFLKSRVTRTTNVIAGASCSPSAAPTAPCTHPSPLNPPLVVPAMWGQPFAVCGSQWVARGGHSAWG